MTDVAALTKRFGMAELLTFDEFSGLTRIQVHTPAANATVFLQGAHMTAWQPSGAKPVIFVSRKSEYAPGKAIRGGIPVVFPWFATDSKPDRIDGHPGPSHGFARTQTWELVEARSVGEHLHLKLTLGPTEISRSMGFDHFLLTLEFRIGRDLNVYMTVRNLDEKPLRFEEALHTYYAVSDVHEVVLGGLEGKPYIDKTANFKLTPAAGESFMPTQATDRIYNNAPSTCLLHDRPWIRTTIVAKFESASTVVFNPWKAMPDLGDWEWHEFLAVETANVGPDAITLPPKTEHTMQMWVYLGDVNGATPAEEHSPHDRV